MKPTLPLVFALIFAGAWVSAQDTDTAPSKPETASVWNDMTAQADTELDTFLWRKRPVVVFADSANDPRFSQQIALLQERAEELAERDVVVLTDTDPAARGPLRTELRPRGFMIVFIGKDGVVRLRKASPWDVRELTRVIDKTPTRQREIRERRAP